jgi:hypothetical protein
MSHSPLLRAKPRGRVDLAWVVSDRRDGDIRRARRPNIRAAPTLTGPLKRTAISRVALAAGGNELGRDARQLFQV